MSKEITTTSASSPLLQVVNTYLSSVKTKNGNEPDQATKENFIATCVAYELNPIKRQAYLTGYDSKDGAKFTFIIGIDGFTTIASRTGQYAGKDQARFTFQEGKLDSASVTVYRLVNNQKCAFTGQAFYDESVQTTKDFNTKQEKPNSMWTKMPRTMLEKCAFAKALRSAFPESLSGLYTDDEITQEPIKIVVENEVYESIIRLIGEFCEKANKDFEEVSQFWCDYYKVTNLDQITPAEGKQLLKAVTKKLDEIKKTTTTNETEKEIEGLDLEVQPIINDPTNN